MKALNHFRTITKHRHLVMRGCFAVGLYKQGLLHDLSKYTPSEFVPGCFFYQGTSSPNNAERKVRGVSNAWLHHKGRNKHHLEYWIDYSPEHDGHMAGMRMPVNYVVEMYVDRVCASKNYRGAEYTERDPLAYYEKGKGHYMMHPDSERLLAHLLKMLSEKGELYTNQYIKNVVLKKYNKRWQGFIPWLVKIINNKGVFY